jgi:hypothetical protein
MYGSGFPKSLDVSKAIDKRGGQGATLTTQIGEALRQAREKRNISKSQADQMFCDGTTNWTWFEGRPSGQRPPTPETFARIVAEWQELAPLADLIAEAEREVVGQTTKARSTNGKSALPTIGGETIYQTWDETAPSTPEAKQWEGWGTALKPAFEPIVVARKPLIGTVAENVLTHGTGGLNIDGSRIGTDTERGTRYNGKPPLGGKTDYHVGGQEDVWHVKAGRWPANVILDEYSAELLDEQSGESKSTLFLAKKPNNHETSWKMSSQTYAPNGGYADTGGASRFFYVAKASKRDRNEGLENLDERQSVGGGGGVGDYLDDVNSASGKFGSEKAPAKNFHPTVKPTDLMRYLIKLVTPPGGVVLDPFTGSGSTGKAAILEGFRFIGCELTEDYIPIIQGRLDYAEEQVRRAEEKKDEALF